MNTIIRPATLADADAILPLVEQFVTSFAVDRQAFLASFHELLQISHAQLSVAEFDQHPIGYLLGFEHATFYANGRVAWVEELMVHSHYRRQGIGQSLMSAFEIWAIQRGARVVALATRRAAGFYRALGYEESAIYFRRLL
jgi:GNAT superfamily N-acetyltransferase